MRKVRLPPSNRHVNPEFLKGHFLVYFAKLGQKTPVWSVTTVSATRCEGATRSQVFSKF
jgi:hypothetical protein